MLFLCKIRLFLDMSIKITSKENANIKQLIKWQKPRHRKTDGVVVVEGIKEVRMALKAGFQLLEVYYCPEIQMLPELKKEFDSSARIFEITKLVYAHIAYRESTEGVIGVFKEKSWNFEQLNPAEKATFFVLENIEKPGNLGAILRTANALGISGIITTEQSVDLYNPNVIRSSLGSVFYTPVFHTSNAEALAWLKKYHFKIYATSVQFSEYIHHIDYASRSALVLGTESSGLSDFWINQADQCIKIPMQGQVSSFNVSVAAAIIGYEALRGQVKAA